MDSNSTEKTGKKLKISLKPGPALKSDPMPKSSLSKLKNIKNSKTKAKFIKSVFNLSLDRKLKLLAMSSNYWKRKFLCFRFTSKR